MKVIMIRNENEIDTTGALLIEIINLTELNSILIKNRLLKIRTRSCQVVNIFDPDCEITYDLSEAFSILLKQNNIKTLAVSLNEDTLVKDVYPLLTLVKDLDKLKLLKAKQDNAKLGEIL